MNEPEVQSHSTSRAYTLESSSRSPSHERARPTRSEPIASPNARSAFGKTADRRLQACRHLRLARRRQVPLWAEHPSSRSSSEKLPSNDFGIGIEKEDVARAARAQTSVVRVAEALVLDSKSSCLREFLLDPGGGRIAAVVYHDDVQLDSLGPVVDTRQACLEPSGVVVGDDDDREIVHRLNLARRHGPGSSVARLGTICLADRRVARSRFRRYRQSVRKKSGVSVRDRAALVGAILGAVLMLGVPVAGAAGDTTWTLAGTGAAADSGDGGQAREAAINQPQKRLRHLERRLRLGRAVVEPGPDRRRERRDHDARGHREPQAPAATGARRPRLSSTSSTAPPRRATVDF